MTPTGLTADGTWQFGVRRTVAIAPDAAWDLLASSTADWLGDPDARLEPRAGWRAPDGSSGEVTSVTPGEVVRTRWRADDEAAPSILQVRVIPGRTGTALAFHHERLPDAAARRAAAERWNAALDALEARAA